MTNDPGADPAAGGGAEPGAGSRGGDPAGAPGAGPDDGGAGPFPAAQLRPRARRRRDPALILFVAVVLLVGLAGTGWAWRESREHNREDSDRRAVVAIAQSYAVNITTYDHATLDRDFARVLDNSTGAFKSQYTQASQSLRELIAQFKATATGKVLETAVASVDGRQAQVLLFVDQTVVNANTKEPRVDRSRMKMGLEKDGDRWLISSLDLI